MINKKKINAIFLIGLPDSKEVAVQGYNQDGKLVYMWNGNSDFYAQIIDKNISSQTLNILWFEDINYKISKPDIIINCINDSDICSQSLKKAEKLINFIKIKFPNIKVFNHPELIAKTSRDEIYQNYKNLSGIYIPKTVKIRPKSPSDVILENKKNKINFPFLIRFCGAHQSESLQLIKDNSDIKKLESYSYDNKEYYITQYVDYKDREGLYKKGRLLIIDNKILPRHYMTNQDWLVDGNLHEKYMASREKCKKDEIYFLKNYQKMISKESLKSIKKIYQKSGLDYLGFDFAIRPDKSLLIFEINAAQNVFIKLSEIDFPYMKKVSDKMTKMLNKTIYNKAINGNSSKLYNFWQKLIKR
jgi:glutathione synthase/RimK-type ligase-like ATP-grasp enzyme